MGRAEEHDVIEEGDANLTETGVVGVDVWVGGEWIGEDLGLGEEIVHPFAAVGDGHDAGDDFTADSVGEDRALLGCADVFAIRGVVGAIGHEIPIIC